MQIFQVKILFHICNCALLINLLKQPPKKNNISQRTIPKYNGVEIKRVLYDARRGCPRPEDVLFCRQVVRGLNAFQVTKITVTNTKSMQHAATECTNSGTKKVLSYLIVFFALLVQDSFCLIFY